MQERHSNAGPPGEPSNLQLMQEASRIVSREYPNSILFELYGAPSSGIASEAKDIDRWALFFAEMQCHPHSTIALSYRRKQFGEPTLQDGLHYGRIWDPLPDNMSLEDAMGLARKAGVQDPLKRVEMYKPLIAPPTEALYILSSEQRQVLVGTLTGHVSVVKKDSLENHVTCPTCSGAGVVHRESDGEERVFTCPTCHGRGQIDPEEPRPMGESTEREVSNLV